MGTRRQFLSIAATTVGLTPIVAWLGCPMRDGPTVMGESDPPFPVEKSDAEWRANLTPQQYRVLRAQGTERPFTSPLNDEKRCGTFVCAACGQSLFSSDTKYDSRTGWPSFWKPLDGAVGTSIDRSLFMVRTEVHCAGCGGHLGHVFLDGPRPTGQRYCINGEAMTFNPERS